jgi:NADPH-dependent 2,4-dienoyl-CoA reductase/sulfur reductase-like enzyme
VSEPLRAGGAALDADAIAFDFDGRKLQGRAGEMLAAALTAAGERDLRETRAGERRGLFCGMGVCQECLVEIDGRANQRACMTKLDRPLSVWRQSHLAATLDLPPRATPLAESAETLTPDVLVIGGGAGGLNAAAVAARAGARVLLVDERPQPGGQYYKQPLDVGGGRAAIADDAQFAGGRALIAAAEAAGVTFLRGAQVWGAFEPLDLMIFDGKASRLCRPKRLIVAAGAYERGLAFPGWTLPGVMTTGAAQTLLRSYGVLPGRRVLVAGNGPLNLQVAVELARAGAEIAAVIELARRPGLWATAAIGKMLTSTPALALRGRSYIAELERSGIPLLHCHVIAAIERADQGLRARVAPWPANAGPSRGYEVDALCIGYGFMPSNELLRALGCQHTFDSARGHLVTERDDDGLTGVAHVYAVGDCTGLGGAPAAEAEGIIAGVAVVRSLGLAPAAGEERNAGHARAQLRRHRRFQTGLWELFQAPRLLTELASPETIICRCEELTRAEIESGFDQDTQSIGAAKRATRAGMGRCQGRYCGPVLAALAAARQGVPLDEAAHWAPRPPVKPIAIADIVGR